MAKNMLLTVPDIAGEGPEDTIECSGFKWAMFQKGTAQIGTGASGPRLEPKDACFYTYLNKAVPNLFLNCAKGTNYDEVSFSVFKRGGDPLEYFTFTMYNAIISGVEFKADEDTDIPRVEIRFNFEKYKTKYDPQESGTGAGSGPVEAGFDMYLLEPL